ncbi:MAG TPA: SCO family protein [Gaiellaceae bacterium]|nr:SCO family protein [Gaiellaceae bacterium]
MTKLRAALLSVLTLILATTACGSAGAPDLAGTELPGREAAPDFALADAEGTTVRLSDERGKLVFVTFLYTQCPDVCPFIAESLNRALVELGPDSGSVRVLAVSVDPEGDTAARVREYAADHRLRPEFTYLIGSSRELEPVWRDYGIAAFAADPESRLVDHSAQTFLIDEDGRSRAVYSAGTSTADFVGDARALLDR